MFVGLYPPVYRQVLWFSPSRRARRKRTTILATTTTSLAQSLDPDRLWATLVDGIRTALGTTQYAVFRRDAASKSPLCLTTAHSIADLPAVLVDEVWQPILTRVPRVADSARLQRVVETTDPDILHLVDLPSVAAWCVIQADHQPVGLIILGLRNDLSAYDDEELDALDPVIAAASIAFAKSVEYQARVAAEEKVRKLYHQLQMIEDSTKSRLRPRSMTISLTGIW